MSIAYVRELGDRLLGASDGGHQIGTVALEVAMHGLEELEVVALADEAEPLLQDIAELLVAVSVGLVVAAEVLVHGDLVAVELPLAFDKVLELSADGGGDGLGEVEEGLIPGGRRRTDLPNGEFDAAHQAPGRRLPAWTVRHKDVEQRPGHG